ncbi:MAG: hypothetical protein ACOYN6_16455, partial [Ignavibacteria bacterium]
MKKILLYLLIYYSLLVVDGFSQPQFEWVRNYSMRASAVAIDSTGNIYTVGYIGTSVHILKYNSIGNLIWHRYDTLNTTGNGICAVADKQGNVYVTADGFSGPSGAYLRTLKYDSTGTEIWLRYCFATEANAMCLDNVGNIYIAGQKTIIGRYNYITIKYNPQGDTIWTATYQSPGTSGGSVANALYVDFQYNVYVTGGSLSSSYSKVNKYVENKPTQVYGDYATIKYNSSGVQQWVAVYGGPVHYSGASDIVVDKYGYSYVTGGVSLGSNREVFGTIKYTPNGDSVWTRLFVPPLSVYTEYGNKILLDSSLNIYVSGRGSDSTHPSGSFRTIKYDGYGNLLWSISDTGGIMPKSMVLDKNSNIYVTGDDNYSRFYSVCYNSAGNKIWSFYYPPLYPSWIYSGIKITLDRFNNLYIYGSSLDSAVLLKFSALTGIVRNSELNPSSYSLSQNYPNPFNPTTNIKFSIVNSGEVKLVVYDIQGREVQTLVNESLKPGTYEA